MPHIENYQEFCARMQSDIPRREQLLVDKELRVAVKKHNFDVTPLVLRGDCIEIGKQLLRRPKRFNLVFGDPPFNIGHGYAGHHDNMTRWEFEHFMHEWLDIGSQLITRNGLLAVHGNDDVAAITIRHLEPRLDRKHWIQWHYRFGQAGAVDSATKCITSKAHLLVWSRPGSTTTFNPPLVLTAL